MKILSCTSLKPWLTKDVTAAAHRITETSAPVAASCPVSGYPQVATTRRWVEFRIDVTYTDGHAPVSSDIETVDATAPDALEAAQTYARRVRRVVPHLSTVKLSRVHRVETTLDIHPDFSEDYAQNLAAGSYDPE